MAEDYYKTLGISRDASPADIQKAHRKLARKYHPDLHPDDKTAKQKFQEVQRAFDVLNDPAKRELYDRYGSSFESMGSGGGPRGGPGGPRPQWGGPTGGEDVDFSQMFGERFGADTSGGSWGDIFGQFRRAGGRQRRESTAVPTAPTWRQNWKSPSTPPCLAARRKFRCADRTGKSRTCRSKFPPASPRARRSVCVGEAKQCPVERRATF